MIGNGGIREPRTSRKRKLATVSALLLTVATAAFATSSCVTQGHAVTGAQTFVVNVTKVNGIDPPTIDNPLPANHGDVIETWDADVQAVDVDGKPTQFDGYTRLSVHNGTVTSVLNLDTGNTEGRNLLVQGGHASGRISLTAVYGPSRLWVEDLGYTPAPAGTTPECSDGKNNDPKDDSLIDFPDDPGCAYADDNTETGGTFATGTSANVYYALPAVRDVQGGAATTPYLNDAIQVRSDDPQFLVVTRISKDGFYVTDLTDQTKGYNNLFAFNFSTPAGMQVCDRVTYLSGTVGEFFGFTELNFPSYRLLPLLVGQEDQCPVPEPFVIDDASNADVTLQKHLAGLVRLQNYLVPKNFGATLIQPNASGVYVPAPSTSNCDLNGDGKVDFASADEGACNTACEADLDCSEWNDFLSNNSFKVHDVPGNHTMKVDASSAPGFLATGNPGLSIDSITGTLRKFSGGSLKWTIEVRCPDDLLCSVDGCATQTLDAKHACVDITRTIYDNDEGTN